MLLQMLKDWLRRRAGASRAIFQYWDGHATRAIDPMVAYRILACHPTFIWREHPKQIERDHAALAVTLQAVRDAFEIKPLTTDGGHGLSEGETLDLFVRFSEFLEHAKKNTSSYLILPPPTERPSSRPIKEETMKPSSDSGSTSVEPKPEKPAESPAESSPLSESLP